MAPLAGVCIDQFEASVWVIPSALVAKALQGKLTAAALTAGGAVQVGAAGDDYPAFCPDTGNGCRNQMHALSLRGVAPSRFITWFQAAAACANAGKRLPTNAEWQVAAFATPDDASCVVDAPEPGPTGTQTCISEWGVYDMVGNVWELVADLVPTAALCTDPIFPGTEDRNCTRNVTATEPTPGAVLRGGAYNLEQESGVFAMVWQGASQTSSNNIGFRCAL
jgi:formylglycine-generating enzyme required for sulfatase activity